MCVCVCVKQHQSHCGPRSLIRHTPNANKGQVNSHSCWLTGLATPGIALDGWPHTHTHTQCRVKQVSNVLTAARCKGPTEDLVSCESSPWPALVPSVFVRSLLLITKCACTLVPHGLFTFLPQNRMPTRKCTCCLDSSQTSQPWLTRLLGLFTEATGNNVLRDNEGRLHTLGGILGLWYLQCIITTEKNKIQVQLSTVWFGLNFNYI